METSEKYKIVKNLLYESGGFKLVNDNLIINNYNYDPGFSRIGEFFKLNPNYRWYDGIFNELKLMFGKLPKKVKKSKISVYFDPKRRRFIVGNNQLCFDDFISFYKEDVREEKLKKLLN